MSLLVNLGFAVQDAGSERGPGRAVLPAALTCLGDRVYLCPLYSAQHRCNIGQGSPLRRGTAVADPDHRRWVGVWWPCSCSCKCGEAESLVSPSKAASHKVADGFSARASSQLLQGHHPPLLLATVGPSQSGRAHAFMQTIRETNEPKDKSHNSVENGAPTLLHARTHPLWKHAIHSDLPEQQLPESLLCCVH